MIKLQAHKGVSTENPENTMPAFLSAAEQGYEVIELDVSVTKDLQFVLLHDAFLNRTARNQDGSELTEKIAISEITYEEALAYDFGIWFSRKFAGTRIPLFLDVLKMAREQGMRLKIDNKYLHFSTEEKTAFFQLLKGYEDVAELTCNSVEAVREAVENFPAMRIHYDGLVDLEHLEALSALIKKERLIVWLPFENAHTSWVTVPFADETLAALVKPYAQLGIWILSEYAELDAAEKLGAEIVETNGQLKPIRNQGVIADMHTHSENSHDSTCKMEDMCLAEISRGTRIMANTDHCDITSFDKRDIGEPIRRSFETAMEVRERHKEECMVLTGVEIGGGLWYPRECQIIQKQLPYDVLIGSVHGIRPGIGKPMAEYTVEDAHLYVETYLKNVLEMVREMELDILAHLTYPIRYACGIHKIPVDMSRFDDIVEEILKEVIRRGIALEINTSSYYLLDDFMPGRNIIKKYREMGGYLITLASDAHAAENAAINFEKALDFLKETGFRNIFYFENRKCYQCTI